MEDVLPVTEPTLWTSERMTRDTCSGGQKRPWVTVSSLSSVTVNLSESRDLNPRPVARSPVDSTRLCTGVCEGVVRADRRRESKRKEKEECVVLGPELWILWDFPIGTRLREYWTVDALRARPQRRSGKEGRRGLDSREVSTGWFCSAVYSCGFHLPGTPGRRKPEVLSQTSLICWKILSQNRPDPLPKQTDSQKRSPIHSLPKNLEVFGE